MYIFRCRKCNCETETPTREPAPACPHCGDPMTRKFTAPAVHYRVSGFYSMDKHLTPVKPEDYNPMED